MKRKMGFDSICAKDLPEDNRSSFSHTLPIYASSTFIYESAEKAMSVFRGEEEAYIYSRWSNPTVEAVEKKIAALEGYGLEAELSCKLFSSGMAAISAVFMALLKPGDTIVTHHNIYGTTTEMIEVILGGLGIKPEFIDARNLQLLEDMMKQQQVKAVYIETPANPTIDCYDLNAIGQLCQKYSIKLIVDNTFSTPYLQQPFKYGADFVIHSATKFLNGHGTALGGALIGKDLEFMAEKGWQMRKLLGGNSNPFDAWLLNNGLKTLSLRMERHCSNARKVATYLEGHPAVAKVNYTGLPSHRDHHLAKRQMHDFGGMLSFELKGGLQAGIRMMNNIRFLTLTASLGTPDTLIQHPASMTHVKVSKEQQLKGGITEGLIRLSVGIENVEDIIDDLDRSLSG